mmetsp:Transcript_42375/g.47162  ORF Transcript_42375/g.47162 Transcript_42375/m.47162 type:complete len:85 (+) Transcript_42375:650-904(+)
MNSEDKNITKGYDAITDTNTNIRSGIDIDQMNNDIIINNNIIGGMDGSTIIALAAGIAMLATMVSARHRGRNGYNTIANDDNLY